MRTAGRIIADRPLHYRGRRGLGLSPIAPLGALLLAAFGLGSGGCSLSRGVDSYVEAPGHFDVTGSIDRSKPHPTEADLAFARTAASDVLTRGAKDASQPWENPSTGARGSVTPIAVSYEVDGRLCRDFLASYVNGKSEAWMQGAACQTERGSWEIRTLKSWRLG